MRRSSPVPSAATLACALALASVGALTLARAANAQDAARGEELFHQHACYSCHGYNGAGRTPLDARVSGILSDEGVFIQFLRLRAEQNPTLPSSQMPNYPAESLPDADARDLYAYIVGLEHAPPAIEDIPAFQAILDAAEDG